MSFINLLSPDRRNFVNEIFIEMSNATTNTYDRENKRNRFLQLVKENKELFENEKEYCRETFIYNFELNNILYGFGEPRECKNCSLTKYSDRFCEKCISLHLQSFFGTWTSGNEIVDNFIKECQTQSSLPRHILEYLLSNL